VGQRLGEVPLLLSGAADLLGIQADQQVRDHLRQYGDLGGQLLQRGYLPDIRLRQAEAGGSCSVEAEFALQGAV
jgi:hypothetical protein